MKNSKILFTFILLSWIIYSLGSSSAGAVSTTVVAGGGGFLLSAIIAALIIVGGLYIRKRSEKKIYQNIGIAIIVIGAIVALSSMGGIVIKASIGLAVFLGIIYYAYTNYIDKENGENGAENLVEKE